MAAKLAQSVGMICTSTGAGRCVAHPADTMVANSTASIDVFMITVYGIVIYWSSPQRLPDFDQAYHHGFVLGFIRLFDFSRFV